MMKRLFWIPVAVALLFGALQARAQQVYFSAEEMPDLIQCLPAPPDTLSSAFTYDIMRYMWGKAQRQDPERLAMALRDGVWSYEALLTELSVPFGLDISEAGTPAIWRVLVNSLATTDQMRVAPKAYYHRMRPFVRFNEEPMVPDDAQFSGEGSYPSGHTMRSWTAALLLSEINPAAANLLFDRAWKCGESRVISGSHWQSDVDVTRVGASIGFARLQTSADFRAQMDLAREEFRRLTCAAGQQ